jgi:hypothetical protein
VSDGWGWRSKGALFIGFQAAISQHWPDYLGVGGQRRELLDATLVAPAVCSCLKPGVLQCCSGMVVYSDGLWSCYNPAGMHELQPLMVSTPGLGQYRLWDYTLYCPALALYCLCLLHWY